MTFRLCQATFTCVTVNVCEGATREERVHYLTKQCQFEYSTALDGKGEVGAVKDGDKVII